LAVPAPGDFGVGVFFFPRADIAARVQAKQIVESTLVEHNLPLLTWRAVPIDLDALGDHARSICPHIEQAIIARPPHVAAGDAFERRLVLARKEIERRARVAEITPLYAPSLSSRTIVYKGLLVSLALGNFYADLTDPLYETALALFHQRYSTNTFPNWERAQPFRFLCHNGEINTLQGNVAWMRAREPYLASPLWVSPKALLPIIDTDGSDSAMLDNALELLSLSGRDLVHAQMMLMPEAWEKIDDLPPSWKAFYRYHSTLMEPWDGPAAIAYSDGRVAGMALDRNGLRPARYVVTDDGLIVAASEAGALEIDPARVIEKGKLGPGQCILADLERGRLLHNDEVKNQYAARQPYQQWLDEQMKALPEHLPSPFRGEGVSVTRQQALFGYTDEELVVVLKPMATGAAEPTGSMGDDTPPAVLSEFKRPLYHYFKQRFAEVTNPPLDSLRETLVMSLRVLLGARGNLLEESPAPAHLLELDSPFLTRPQLDAIRAMDDEFAHALLSATFVVNDDPDALARAVENLCAQAERAVNAGNVILILSDRVTEATRAPIPMLLAVSAVHHHLLRVGKRWSVSLIAEVGDAHDVHQFACLIGYGADAINPYLALASVRTIAAFHPGKPAAVPDSATTLSPARAEENFIHAGEKGLLKIMSKMGIATLDSYHGAQIFEIIGLNDAVVQRYFTGTPTHISGISLGDLGRIVLTHHAHAFNRDEDSQLYLKNYGFFKFKKEGEYHGYNPTVVKSLHAAVTVPGALNGSFQNAYEKYREFSIQAHDYSSADLSDHLDILFGQPIPLSEVESASKIVKRFSSA
ncbi:MAG TPA: glutamate synthase central domain-containing protein, partial [Anaerolineae bacterium]